MAGNRSPQQPRKFASARILAALAALSWAVAQLSDSCQAWASPRSASQAALDRRAAVSSVALLGVLGLQTNRDAAWASGGSTAGKYSTIPSGKRRFYGRVRQGIYQFLLMEEPITAGNLKDPLIADFFDKNILKQAGGQTVKNCNFAECKTKEKRTSRWLDFKLASDLLASAFRYDASDVNDYLPQVKLIRAFAKKVEKIQKEVEADNGDTKKVQTLYAQCKNELNKYTSYVELTPINSEDYTHPWDTRPQIQCTGSFCV